MQDSAAHRNAVTPHSLFPSTSTTQINHLNQMPREEMPPVAGAAAACSQMVPKTDIEVLSQEIWEDEAKYRIRAWRRVHYLTIRMQPHPVFDDLTLSRPYLLIPKLPPFPNSDWTTMEVFRGPNGDIETIISSEPLAQVQSTWHSVFIDILSLRRISSYNARVKEVEFEGRTAISKTAIFEQWIPQIDHETWAYEMIAKHQLPDDPPLAPTFLGHLTEQGRTIGFLVEKIEGDYASLDDLPECELALRRLHDLGLLHGDPNRYNFVVDSTTGHVKMIDFEHVQPYDEDKAQLELEELKKELTEETGRGTSVIIVEGGERRIQTAPTPYMYQTDNKSTS